MSVWIESMIHQLMEALGYTGVAILMFLECIFPPIPSELIVPLAGFSTVRGEYSFLWVCVAATLGSVLGAIVLYSIGKLVGGVRLIGWADRYGKWLGVSGKDIHRAIRWFEKHGNAVVFFCRFVPGIRSLISIPAGMASMNMLPFTLYTTVGSALWVAALAYVGRLLGDNYELVDTYIGPLGTLILILVALTLFGWIVWRIVRRRRSSRSQLEQTPTQILPQVQEPQQLQCKGMYPPAIGSQQPPQFKPSPFRQH
ncbi:DedA family protein [Ktedonospora formicarum]|uniref:VTT domain-containing protein n=1 Tax=Ktedonospora formicarum TaxID=2778364 RepID=A0A8J3IC59_9CHLR|nr:DedA family protein [Ktedonospora formicarum]GHO50565.1 hypothetical protein KSX_87280 [Ktedonospora formicarum]